MSSEPSRKKWTSAEWFARAREFEDRNHEEDLRRWAAASYKEKGEALAALLRFVSAAGRFPPKTEMFPGWRRIVAEQKARQ